MLRWFFSFAVLVVSPLVVTGSLLTPSSLGVTSPEQTDAIRPLARSSGFSNSNLSGPQVHVLSRVTGDVVAHDSLRDRSSLAVVLH